MNFETQRALATPQQAQKWPVQQPARGQGLNNTGLVRALAPGKPQASWELSHKSKLPCRQPPWASSQGYKETRTTGQVQNKRASPWCPSWTSPRIAGDTAPGKDLLCNTGQLTAVSGLQSHGRNGGRAQALPVSLPDEWEEPTSEGIAVTAVISWGRKASARAGHISGTPGFCRHSSKSSERNLGWEAHRRRLMLAEALLRGAAYSALTFFSRTRTQMCVINNPV